MFLQNCYKINYFHTKHLVFSMFYLKNIHMLIKNGHHTVVGIRLMTTLRVRFNIKKRIGTILFTQVRETKQSAQLF